MESTIATCVEDPSATAAISCSPAQWSAFVKIGQIKEILTPRFAQLVDLARAEGLLDALIAQDQETARSLGQKTISSLEELTEKRC